MRIVRTMRMMRMMRMMMRRRRRTSFRDEHPPQHPHPSPGPGGNRHHHPPPPWWGTFGSMRRGRFFHHKIHIKHQDLSQKDGRYDMVMLMTWV